MRLFLAFLLVLTSVVTSATGIVPRMSNESRLTASRSSGARRAAWSASTRWVSRPRAGATCCSSSRQAPRTWSVGRKEAGPVRSK